MKPPDPPLRVVRDHTWHGLAPLVRLLLALALLLGVAAAASGQTQTTRTNRLSVGASPTSPAVGTVRLEGLGTAGGTQVLLVDANFDVIRRILAKSDLPAAVAYEDEANTFAGLNTFTGVVDIANATPLLNWYESDAGAGLKYSRLIGSGGQWALEHLNDAYSAVLSRPMASSAFGSLVLSPYAKQVLPGAPYEGTIGSPLRKWLAIYAAELNVETLVAQEVMATTGGRVLVGPTTSLLEAIDQSATTIRVAHNNLASGDRVYLESEGRVEFLAVTSGATRINVAGVGNLSVENGTTDWTTTGTAALSRSEAHRFRGAGSLRWSHSSGTANVIFIPAGMLANSTTYTVSIYVKRADLAPVVPVAGTTYRLYVDANNPVTPCDSVSTDVGDGWYRLSCSGTTGSSGAAGVGVVDIPTSTVHFFDAVQVEAGTTLTPWSVSSASYTVTRDLDGSGANVWEAGTAVFNTGQAGNGFLDLYATRGIKASTEVGPSIVGNVRLSSTYNDWAPRWAVGNLNGLYGYGATTFGAAFGDPSAANLTLDATNGIRFRNGTTPTLQITGSQIDLMNSGFIRSGPVTALDAGGTGLFLNAGSGTPQFRVGTLTSAGTPRYLRWTGTDLEMRSDHWRASSSGIKLNALASFTASASIGFLDAGAGEFANVYANDGAGANDTLILEMNSSTGAIRLVTGTSAANQLEFRMAAGASANFRFTQSGTATGHLEPGTTGVQDLGKTAGAWRHLWFAETSTAPATPASGTEAAIRLCGDQLVIVFNDAGTTRWKYLALSGTGTTWTHATSAPSGC